MSNPSRSASLQAQETIEVPPEQTGQVIVTHEQSIDELIPPPEFSEDERIRILWEITDLATHSHSNRELYEGCLQKIFDAIPGAERSTILIDLDGELFPVKHFPRDQAYYSETFVQQTRAKRKAFSWVRNQAKGAIPRSAFDAVAAMYAPMIRNGRVTGILHVDSTSLTQGFRRSEVDMLSVIASILALSFKPDDPEQGIPSVFISYAHTDAAFANALKGDLRRSGISVWIDEQLRAGDVDWKKQLEIAIQKQHSLLFLMTPGSVASEFCQWEIGTALDSKKEVITLLVEDTQAPESILKKQYIDFRGDDPKAFNALIEAIHRAFQGPQGVSGRNA